MNIVHVLCECNSNCTKSVQLELEVLRKIVAANYIVIVAGCTKGPSKSDVLVEERAGYSLYMQVV